MPELPEVETISRQLHRAIRGKEIKNVNVLHPKSFQGLGAILIGKKVAKVERKAKVIIIHLSNGFPKVLIHLKMTGQLIFQYHISNNTSLNNAENIERESKTLKRKTQRITGGHPTLDWIANLPSKHTRVVITFTDSSQLFFNDMRIFGWMKVITEAEQLHKELKNFQGIEPLTPELTTEYLTNRFARTQRAIKLVILDQNIIAGLGNIYANDALFEALIHPLRPAHSLTPTEIDRLIVSINKVIALGIKHGGATQSDYRQLDGMGGKYQDYSAIYKKEGTSCINCGSKVVKIKVGGRGTYYCPHCQK